MCPKGCESPLYCVESEATDVYIILELALCPTVWLIFVNLGFLCLDFRLSFGRRTRYYKWLITLPRSVTWAANHFLIRDCVGGISRVAWLRTASAYKMSGCHQVADCRSVRFVSKGITPRHWDWRMVRNSPWGFRSPWKPAGPGDGPGGWGGLLLGA